MSKFTRFRDKIVSFFSNDLWEFFSPFVKSLEKAGSQLLITAAENAVERGFNANGSGQEKMAAALAEFQIEVKAKGLPFIESQARTLIELALQKAKS